MSEGATGFLAQADKVLKLLIDESVKPGANDGDLSPREVMDALGMTWEQFRPVAIHLLEAKYIGGDWMGGPDGGSLWVTTKGIEFYERRRETPSLHVSGNVGAIYQGSVQGTQIQAVASAVYSSVQQVVEGTQVKDIRQTLTQTIEDMVRAVQQELTVEELAVYTRIASEFRQEVAKENPDKGRLWRALPVLSILGDMEGTIQLAERAFTLASHVAPYVPLLVTLLARLLS